MCNPTFYALSYTNFTCSCGEISIISYLFLTIFELFLRYYRYSVSLLAIHCYMCIPNSIFIHPCKDFSPPLFILNSHSIFLFHLFHFYFLGFLPNITNTLYRFYPPTIHFLHRIFIHQLLISPMLKISDVCLFYLSGNFLNHCR